MENLRAVARLVDGGEQDLYVPADLLRRLAILQHDGVSGNALVHELFTDDWGAPPLMIVIAGTDDAGMPVNLTLEYD